MFFFFVVCRKQTNPRMCCIRPCTLCVETAMSTWQKKTGAVCFTASPVDLECSLESKTFTRLTLISSISFRSTFIAAATAAPSGINTSGAGDRVIFDRTVLTNTACRVSWNVGTVGNVGWGRVLTRAMKPTRVVVALRSQERNDRRMNNTCCKGKDSASEAFASIP